MNSRKVAQTLLNVFLLVLSMFVVVGGFSTKPNHKRLLSVKTRRNMIGVKLSSHNFLFELYSINRDASTDDADFNDDSRVTIYQLVCNDESMKDVHIEHTIMDIEEAMINHQLTCQNTNAKRYNSPLYKQIRTNGGWKNWHHEILEICVSVDDETVLRKKREWIEKTPNVMNILRPILSSEEDNDTYNKELMKVMMMMMMFKLCMHTYISLCINTFICIYSYIIMHIQLYIIKE
jgi:hypothetical protein